MQKHLVWLDFGILATMGFLVVARLMRGHVLPPELIIPGVILLGALLGRRDRGR
jgi:hypothetical protein